MCQFFQSESTIISSIVYSAEASLYLACVVDELTGADRGFFLRGGAHSSFVSGFFFFRIPVV